MWFGWSSSEIHYYTVFQVVFEGLVPGRLYTVNVWTVSKEVTSQPLIRQDRLYPEAVTGINATFISDTEITLAWIKPKGDYDSFEVCIPFKN